MSHPSKLMKADDPIGDALRELCDVAIAYDARCTGGRAVPILRRALIGAAQDVAELVATLTGEVANRPPRNTDPLARRLVVTMPMKIKATDTGQEGGATQ